MWSTATIRIPQSKPFNSTNASPHFLKTVVPIAVEPIIQQDGNNKNDRERNAVGRLLILVRKMHPKLKMSVIEDGLASNGPHMKDLIALNFAFILGAKPNDHKFLFENFA